MASPLFLMAIIICFIATSSQGDVLSCDERPLPTTGDAATWQNTILTTFWNPPHYFGNQRREGCDTEYFDLDGKGYYLVWCSFTCAGPDGCAHCFHSAVAQLNATCPGSRGGSANAVDGVVSCALRYELFQFCTPTN